MTKHITVKDMLYIAVFTAIIAVMAQISIPMPAGVPMTLQTLAVPLAGLILGAKRGTAAAVLYVLLGVFGAPVFAGFAGGPGVVFGVTGGFILSFPFMAWAAGMGSRGRAGGRTAYLRIFAGLLAGAAVNYLVGMLWFSLQTGRPPGEAFAACVLPFLPTSVIKILVSAWLGPVLRRALERAGVLRPGPGRDAGAGTHTAGKAEAGR